jgi:hypothetical protein
MGMFDWLGQLPATKEKSSEKVYIPSKEVTQAPNYIRDLKEFSADNFEQVITEKAGTGWNTIYTVPDGYTLYLTSLYASFMGVTNDYLLVGIFPGGNYPRAILLKLYLPANGGATSESLSFDMPLKVYNKEKIMFYNSSIVGSVGFTGFLMKKAI